MDLDNNPFANAPAPGAGPGKSSTPPDNNAKTMATFAHLGVVAGMIIPFGSILTPLIIWLTQKDKSSYVDHHGKEALNFQITMVIVMIASAILIFIFIGFILLIAAAIANLVLSIMAAIKANEGVLYEYPFNFRFIK